MTDEQYLALPLDQKEHYHKCDVCENWYDVRSMNQTFFHAVHRLQVSTEARGICVVYPDPPDMGPKVLDEQIVINFNKQQQLGNFHPLTCGNRNNIRETHKDGEGVLRLFADGVLRCPYCDYKQPFSSQYIASL
jgi:hypothetical protein